VSYGLLEDVLDAVGQVGASLRVAPSSQFCDARPAQPKRTADDDLELLLADKVHTIGSLLGEKGREQGGAGVVVAAEQVLVRCEPVVDGGRVAFHGCAGESVVLKALQQIADIGKGKGHGFVRAWANPSLLVFFFFLQSGTEL
jgi:hypothetical protein